MLGLSIARRNCSRKPKASHQFRPCVGGRSSDMDLEGRFLTAPTIIRRSPFTGLRAGTSSHAGTNSDIQSLGVGLGWDNLYATHASAVTGTVAYTWNFPPPLGTQRIRGEAFGSVINDVTGPGSSNLGDPNPAESPTIFVSVKHDATVKMTNYTSDWQMGGGVSNWSKADTNNLPLTYDLKDVGDGATVQVTFTVNWTSSGVVGIGETPYLDLKTPYFDVNIDQWNGYVVRDKGGNIIESDPSFVFKRADSKEFGKLVQDEGEGTDLDIKYSSELSASADSAWAFPPGTHTAAPTFHWTLKVEAIGP